ncbi:MAG TPA: ATP-binding protein [Opitutaceae bacterium]|nr:ATP-binding protein [Opitutaceae bacterium]
MSTYLIVSSLLNCLGALLLAFAVVLRERSNRLNQRFGLFAFSIAGWCAAYFLWQISPDAGRALFFTRVLMLGAYFVPITHFHFVAQLCGEVRRRWVTVGYAFACLFTALGFSPLMVHHVERAMEFPFWPIAGDLFIVYLAFFAVYLVHAWLLLAKHLRFAVDARASQMRYILVASTIGFTGGATNFPLWYHLSVPPIGNGLILLYLVMMAHAVSRYHLPLVTYDLVKAAVYLVMGATLAIFYVLVAVVVRILLGTGGVTGGMLEYFLLALLVSVFFLWAAPHLRQQAERILEQVYLRRGGQEQRGQLKELARRICTLRDEQEIFETATLQIATAMGVTQAAMFFRGEFDHSFNLRAAHGWGQAGFAARALDSRAPLMRFFHDRQVPLVYDGSEVEWEAEVGAPLSTLQAGMPFEAAFPVFTEDQLFGVLVLGRRRDGRRYSEIDFSLLEAICLQIAITIRARQLERQANQTEKLISLGTLAAGLAHELRNPLVSIQTFSSLLKERGAEPDFQHEFGAIMQRDVGRIASIVENVAAFAENSSVPFAPVKIRDVWSGVAEIVRPELTRTGVTLEVDEPEGIPAVSGNYSQLLQVFLNLVQNAIHALEGRPDPRIVVKLRLRTHNPPKPLLYIAVSDNGPGIDPALLPRVFEPFMTTKSTGDQRSRRGMGLGLAIVRRIIQYHQGAVDVTSELGSGTTFHIYLPALSPPP